MTDGSRTVRLSVMGTTDLHGNVFNWDYFKNAEYDDSAHNDIGLAQISTLVTNYDILGGLTRPLVYQIDIAKPVGSRITDLTYDGAPVAAGRQFVVAVNNYRQSGGGNFPHVKTAPVVYNRQVEIRQLMIDYVTTTGQLSPDAFHTTDWSLTANGTPVVVKA